MNNYIVYTVLNIIIYNFISIPIVYYLFRYKRFIVRKRNCFFIWLLLLVFCLEARYSGDWIHYKEIVENRYSGYWEWSNLEFIYEDIIYIVNGNYIAFRTIIWGGSLFFLYKLFHRLKIHNSLTLSVFAIHSLYAFAYPRVSLGLSCFFWGYTYLIIKYDKENIFINVLKAFSLIVFSFFLHKSMMILLFLFPFSFIDYTSKKIYLILFVFYFFVLLISHCLGILSDFEGLAGVEYLNQDEIHESTIGNTISVMLRIIPVFLLLVSFIFNYSNSKHYITLSYTEKRLYSLCFCLFLTAVLFYFLPLNTSVLYYRTLYMSLIPLVSLLMMNINRVNKRNSKVIIICTILAYIGNNYSLLYNLLGHINGTIK